MATKAKYPYGPATVEVLTAADTTQAFVIENNLTVIDGFTNEATANRTINLASIDESVDIGAKIIVQSKTNGTETTVFGTSITGITITGVAGKTITKSFTYNGTAFLADGEQVD